MDAELFASTNAVDAERFWKMVQVGAENECWPWTGATDDRGYGRFHVGISRNSTMLAHRVAHGLSGGGSPEAVCHECDNPGCCNPKHLFSGTRAVNNLDMVAKGRHWSKVSPEKSTKGEAHGSAKLTDGQVNAIRRRYSNGAVTQRALAKEFGVCQRTITKIVNDIGWRHVKSDR